MKTFVVHLQRFGKSKRVELQATSFDEAYFDVVPKLYPGWDISMCWEKVDVWRLIRHGHDFTALLSGASL